MDYIGHLIKANKALLKKVKQLQTELAENAESADSENIYYAKYNAANEENLNLKNQIAKLELEAYTKDRELEKRNATIIQLRNSLR